MVWQGSAGNRCPYADQTGFQVTFSGLPPSGGEVTEITLNSKPLARRLLHLWWVWALAGLGFGSQGGFPVTRLRQRMLDELQRRNYSPHTVRSYMHAVEEFARHFHRSPDQLGPDHIREYQVHLFRDCKLSPCTIEGQTAALRFLFVKTLGRSYLPDQIPFPKCHKRLPTVLSQEEVTRLSTRPAVSCTER